MGYCPFYQALPESSELGRRLESDRKLRTLLIWLFPYGFRPLDKQELGEAELSSILDEAVERDLFNSRAEVDDTYAELCNEISRTSSAHPGLIDRTAFLEKSQYEIEERLIPILEESGVERADKLVHTLLFGEFSFSEHTEALMIVIHETVQQGAEALRAIEPEMLFDDPDHEPVEDYRAWRNLYLQAAERGEAILVY